MTKWYLFSLLALGDSQPSTIRLSSGGYVDGIVLAIEREDGSGRSFNVTLRHRNGSISRCHVRTVD